MRVAHNTLPHIIVHHSVHYNGFSPTTHKIFITGIKKKKKNPNQCAHLHHVAMIEGCDLIKKKRRYISRIFRNWNSPPLIWCNAISTYRSFRCCVIKVFRYEMMFLYFHLIFIHNAFSILIEIDAQQLHVNSKNSI